MKLHQFISYSLMTAGAAMAVRTLPRRWGWEQANTQAAIMIEWDDVQAVATRALEDSPAASKAIELLKRYKENGATHLAIPEITIDRLLEKGEVSVIQGHSARRVYLQAQNAALADWVAGELQARLPQIDATRGANNIVSFQGDLPTITEIGLGFNPDHAAAAEESGLSLAVRPIGFSWVQPGMIDRTFQQAATLGATVVAVQGLLVPGHEFHIQHTVEALRRHQLTYAFFRETRHQKGDWFVAKQLAGDGLVILAHEFTPTEILDEDLHTAAYRWGNLAVEAGVRLCSVRFFRILHAADPMESVEYIHEISHSLRKAGFQLMETGAPHTAPAPVGQDRLALSGAGLAAAGAATLALDLLPLPDFLKLVKAVGGAIILGGLPLVNLTAQADRGHHHHHDHNHHPHEDPQDENDPHHGHDHHHHHHHGPASATTAYAQKGLALATTVAFPAATAAIVGPNAACILSQAALVTMSGAAAVSATTVDVDYMLGIEEYRGYNLDWLLPLGLTTLAGVFQPNSDVRWLPLAGVSLALLPRLVGQLPPDVPAGLDREHRHAHTHHLSQFQAKIGDAKMILSPRPLRKWSFLSPVGLVAAAIFRRTNHPEAAAVSTMAAAAGQVATLTGFRQGQRPIEVTAKGRGRAWLIGAALAAVSWSFFRLFTRR